MFEAYITANGSAEFQASDVDDNVENHVTTEALIITTKESKVMIN